MNPQRIEKLRAAIGEAGVDGLLVSAPANIRYLAGFTGSSGLLLVTEADAVLFTDGRYGIQAREEAAPMRVVVARGALLRALIGSVKRRKLRRLGFERGRASFELYETLRSSLDCRLKPLAGAVEKLRAVKDATEIEAIRRAVNLNSRVLEASLPELRPGRTEVDVAAAIEHRMRRLGGEKPAFETIVASGDRSALPHARPTHKALRKKQLIILDHGVILDGYSSDMTRTVALGGLAARQRGVYAAVLEAQQAAISAVRAGVRAQEVDREARMVLQRHGLDQAFVHSTGHGVGLEIHEPPRLGKRDKTVLEAGMVVTIEPGAYLEGVGGVRIEDMVLVTERGCEVLTPTSKSLRIL